MLITTTRFACVVALALAGIGPDRRRDDLADDSTGEGEGDEGDGDGESEGDGDGDGDGDGEGDGEGDGDGDGECGPFNAIGEGPCDQLLGYARTGDSCVGLSGCECQGLDCAGLFFEELSCWHANLVCGPSPCAGLDEPSCDAEPLCGRPLVQDIDAACFGPAVFAGCALQLNCAVLVSYACSIGEPESAHLFSSPCLPELGWEPCEPAGDTRSGLGSAVIYAMNY